jgi:two-component system nitrate/nitrite response regulator NarL
MQLHCLLVDDSTGFLASARLQLEQQGVQVNVAETGAEAVRRFADQHPDVVLLDINLDGESGFDVARRMHAATPAVLSDGDSDGPSIILVSTHAEEDYEELIQASPVLGFLSKSYLSAGAIQEFLH